MSAMTHELLQRSSGLPEPVRQALNELATACNLAAIAVNQAFAFQVQYTTAREMRRADEPDEHETNSEKLSPQARVITDLELSAESFHAQTLVTLTRAATLYAVYASQVASALIAGQDPALPGTEQIKPSDLIAALDHYLPEIQFPSPAQDPRLAHQNVEVEAAHKALREVISRQLWGQNAVAYDDPAAVRTGADEPWGVSDSFPETLHHYAAALTWALGVFASAHDGSDAG